MTTSPSISRPDQLTLHEVICHNRVWNAQLEPRAPERRLLRFMMGWLLMLNAPGLERGGLDDYRDWWGESRRTAYRLQAEFRAAFPGETTPTRILGWYKLDWPRYGGWRSLGSIRVFCIACANHIAVVSPPPPNPDRHMVRWRG